MCIDLEIFGDLVEDEEMKTYGEGQRIVEENFEEVYGGIFKNWAKEVYGANGGKKGGW
jgi:hypothetical protein